MDVAIIGKTQDEQGDEGHEELRGFADKFTKIDKTPFDLNVAA